MSLPRGDSGFTHFSLSAILILGEKKGLIKKSREDRRIDEIMQLSYSHNLGVGTEGTGLVDDGFCLDDLSVDPAHVTIQTPAFTGTAVKLCCGEKVWILL